MRSYTLRNLIYKVQAIKYVVVIAAAVSARLPPPPQSLLNKGRALMPALGASQEFFQIAEDESIVQRRTEKSEWQ